MSVMSLCGTGDGCVDVASDWSFTSVYMSLSPLDIS